MTGIQSDNTQRDDSTSDSGNRKIFNYRKFTIPLIVLVIGLIITVAATIFMKANVENVVELEFKFNCKEIQNLITERLEDHERILLSGVAFFNSSAEVTRDKWRTFNLNQDLDKQLPGILGIGYSLLIPPEDLSAHIQEIRSQGFPDYNVKPAGDRETYSSIVYLEPFSGRNLRAFGYDMFSQSVRRAAMEQSRDTGTAALSGKVTLLQETSKGIQAGTLMYVPLYRKGMPTNTIEERRDAIYAWIYSPYRMNDLMEGILGTRLFDKTPTLYLKVFDGGQPSPESLLYAYEPADNMDYKAGTELTEQIPIDFNGHRWILILSQSVGGLFAAEYYVVWTILLGGIIITFLLFTLVLTLLNTRAKAQQIAKGLTIDLQESEKRFINILYSSPDAILLIDENIFVDCNEAATRMLGYSTKTDLLLKHPSKLSPPMQDDGRNSFEKANEMMEIAFAKGFHRFECLHKKANGEDFPVEISLTSISLHGKNLLHCLWTDITLRKKTERRLQESEKMEAVGQLAGGIAHDFNNILMGIFGNIFLAKTKLPKEHPGLKYLENSEQSLDRAKHLTSQLLTFATGGAPIKENVSLSKLVEDILKFDLSGSNIKLKFEYAEDLWSVKVDKGQIEQVFSNLTINAKQAMPNGGTLYITLKNIDIKENTVAGLSKGKYIKGTVRDEGIGIDQKNLVRIFEPFYSTKKTGSGVGLATVYSIVKRHSGIINIDSELGKGTTFFIYLPALKIEPLIEINQPKIPKYSGKQLTGRILLMDDEEDICKYLSNVLSDWGCSVCTTSDGKQVIDVYKQSLTDREPFDVVIMDLTIPGGFGGERAIKELLKIDPKVKCIVSSGYANDPVMANYAEHGFKGIITKPYASKELLKVLSQVLEK